MTTENNTKTCTTDNKYKKKCKNFSFAYKEGYEALEWLEQMKDEVRGGKSAYLVKLLLEDKARKTR